MKKIGIIGSGVVAKTLGTGFIKHGYDVMLGSRDISKLEEWKNQNSGKTGSMEEAAKHGNIIVLATKGSANEEAINIMGSSNIKGKTIIDTTNPIDETEFPPKDGVLNFFTPKNGSLMGNIQEKYPEANFVKAFNSVGSALMVNPEFGGDKPTMFICGDNDIAKKEVTSILDQFGWDAEDMGTSQAAGPIESLCILWCIPGFKSNNWNHAFKLLKVK